MTNLPQPDPATRLRLILDRVPRSQESAQAQWAIVFGLDPSDWAGVVRRGVRLQALAKMIRDLVMEIEGPEEGGDTLASFPEIESSLGLFAVVSQKSGFEFMAPYTGAGQNCLKAASKVLRSAEAYWTLQPEDLEKIAAAVAELGGAVTQSSLPGPAKAWLQQAVADLLEAVDLVSIDGPEALRHAIDTLYGGILTRDLSDEPSLRDKVFSILDKVISVYNAGLILYSIIADVKGLPSLPPIPTTQAIGENLGKIFSGSPKELPPGKSTP